MLANGQTIPTHLILCWSSQAIVNHEIGRNEIRTKENGNIRCYRRPIASAWIECREWHGFDIIWSAMRFRRQGALPCLMELRILVCLVRLKSKEIGSVTLICADYLYLHAPNTLLIVLSCGCGIFVRMKCQYMTLSSSEIGLLWLVFIFSKHSLNVKFTITAGVSSNLRLSFLIECLGKH